MRYDLLHPKALHRALIDHYGDDFGIPSERQVRRWVTPVDTERGEVRMPAYARRWIDEVIAAPEQQEAAPPEWAGRLEAKVDQLVIGAVVDPKVQMALRGLVRRLGVLPKPSAEGFGDLLDTEDPDTAERGDRAAS